MKKARAERARVVSLGAALVLLVSLLGTGCDGRATLVLKYLARTLELEGNAER